MQFMKKIIVFTILAFFALSLTKVHAQDHGIVVTPARLEIKANDIQNKVFEFEVKNTGNNQVNVEVLRAEMLDNNIKFKDLEASSPANWIEFINKDKFTIDPNSEAKMQFKLKNVVDHDASPLILIKIKNDSNEGATFEQNIPFQITILSATQNNNEVLIEQFEASKNIVFDNVSFNIKLKNSVEKALSKPIAYFQVLNPRGEVVQQSIINESLASLKNNENLSKVIEVNLLGNLDFSNIVKSIGNTGEYKAELLVVDTITQKSVIKKISFYYIPWVLPIAVILLLVVVISLVLFIRKPRKAKDKQIKDEFRPKSVLKL